MKRLYFIAIFMACWPCFLLAQLTATQQQRVEAIFAPWNDPGRPGCALGIVQDGTLIYAQGYGSADLEHQVPISPKTVFYAGSVSKQFVAACLMTLVDKGMVSLDDPIQQYLPDFPRYELPITLRHLVHHTSGIRSYLELGGMAGYDWFDYYSDAEIMELIVRQKALNFLPGEEWSYNNSGYFLIAEIVEAVSKMSVDDFAQKELFGPLGMKNSHFHTDPAQWIANRAWSYSDKEGQGYALNLSRFSAVGSGGLYTTVEDLGLWDQNFYHNQLGTTLLELMLTEGQLNSGESANHYAAGLFIGTYKGLETVRHGGAFAGYRAELLRFPKQQFSVIILANLGSIVPAQLANQVADIMLAAELTSPQAPPTEQPRFSLGQVSVAAENLQPYIGTYELQEVPGISVKVSVANDSLQVEQTWNQISYSIAPIGKDEFVLPSDLNIRFIFSEKEEAKPQQLTIIQNGQEMIARRKTLVPLLADITPYLGNYYSAELAVQYRVEKLDNQTITLTILGNGETLNLGFAGEATFVAPGRASIRFERSEGEVRVIKGFVLDGGRVKGIPFLRMP